MAKTRKDSQRVILISVHRMNKKLEARKGELDALLNEKMGIVMEEDDTSDKLTLDVKEALRSVRDEYVILTGTKDCNIFVRTASKVPLLCFMSAIKNRGNIFEKIDHVENSLKKSTVHRTAHLSLSTYAFRSEEFMRSLRPQNTVSEVWNVRFNLIAIPNSTMTWDSNTIQEFYDWWSRMHMPPSKTSVDGWPDLKALCKSAVFVLDDTKKDCLDQSPFFAQLSELATNAEEICVDLFLLYSGSPHHTHGISRILGLVTPIIFSLANTVQKAKAVYNEPLAIQRVASTVLATSTNELGLMFKKLHFLTSSFSAIISNYPHIAAVKNESQQTQWNYLPLPTIDQLVDVTILPEDVKKGLGSSGLSRTPQPAIIRGGMPNTRTTKVSEFIEASPEIDLKVLEKAGVKRKILRPFPEGSFGEGSYSVVSLHKSEDGSECFAVKRCLRAKYAGAWNRIKREASIWVNLKHHNILSLEGYYIHPADEIPALVSAACHDGSIENFLKTNSHIGEQERLSFLRDIICGVEYLHSEGVAHGDLRASNILVQRPSLDTFKAVLIIKTVSHGSKNH